MFTWVGQYAPLELFDCGPKFTKSLSPNVERVVVDQVFFQMFYTSIHSGDIRDRSRKLSEIAPKFGRFWPSQILGCIHAVVI